MTDVIREKTREYFGFGTKRMREIKVCDICGTAVSANRRFCTRCNTKLPHKTLFDVYKSNHRVCANCGIVLSENAKYCPQCGERQTRRRKTHKTADNKLMEG